MPRYLVRTASVYVCVYARARAHVCVYVCVCVLSWLKCLLSLTGNSYL